jgi:ankyrin repeat protein
VKWFLGKPHNSQILSQASLTLVVLICSNLSFGGEIHQAAASGDVSRVNALIRADPESVNTHDTYILFGWTPLIYAVASDHKQVVELLLSHGADVNGKGLDGTTPLEEVADVGHKNMAEFLLSRGADVNGKNGLHWTPLYVAAQAGNIEVAQVLLSHKADVNAKDDSDGTTPLHRAAEAGRKDIVELLLAHGAEVNAKMKFANIDPPLNGEGMTPLHIAVLNNHRDIVELLLAHKADVNAKTYYGDTPLKLATDPWHNKKEIIELLRQHGGKE